LAELPAEFKKTTTGERFLLGNSIETDAPGSIVFASDWQLNIMGQADSVTADGTFNTCPEPFAQVYCIIANFHRTRKNVPVCICLLPDKMSQTYNDVWALLSHSLSEPLKAIRSVN